MFRLSWLVNILGLILLIVSIILTHYGESPNMYVTHNQITTHIVSVGLLFFNEDILLNNDTLGEIMKVLYFILIFFYGLVNTLVNIIFIGSKNQINMFQDEYNRFFLIINLIPMVMIAIGIVGIIFYLMWKLLNCSCCHSKITKIDSQTTNSKSTITIV